MILKQSNIYLFFVICFMFSGCASTKLYSGPTLPQEEIAFIGVSGYSYPKKIILQGNKNTYTYSSKRMHSILPGKYKITVNIGGYLLAEDHISYMNNVSVHRRERLERDISCTTEFEALKGKTYQVHLDEVSTFGRIGPEFISLHQYSSGTGILLWSKYQKNKLELYEYSFWMSIEEKESGKSVGFCKDGTNVKKRDSK